MKLTKLLSNRQRMQDALTAQWERLTDEDIDMLVEGTERLVSALQKRYGYTRKKAQKQIERFLRKIGYRPRSRWERLRDQVTGFVPQYLWWAVGIVIAALILWRYLPGNQNEEQSPAPTQQPHQQAQWSGRSVQANHTAQVERSEAL